MEQRKYPYLEIDPLNLRISPELVGTSLEFELNSCRLQFKLPSPSNPETLAPRGGNDFGFEASDNRIRVRGWQLQEGKSVPKEISVECATLIFSESPELERYRHNEETNANCNQLANELKEIGEQATQLWLRILRWKSGDALNGRVATGYFADSTGVVSIPSINGKPGCTSTQIIAPIILYPNIVDERAWRSAEQSLQKGDEPPLAFDLFADAVYLGSLGDYRRAYLELAMAAEVHMRTRNESGLSNNLNPYVQKEIRGLSYRKHLELFFKQLNQSAKDALTGHTNTKKILINLLEDRNTIVHHGDYTRSVTTDKEVVFSQPQFSTYEDAVKRLLEH